MNDGGVCRTATATPGLLKSLTWQHWTPSTSTHGPTKINPWCISKVRVWANDDTAEFHEWIFTVDLTHQEELEYQESMK